MSKTYKIVSKNPPAEPTKRAEIIPYSFRSELERIQSYVDALDELTPLIEGAKPEEGNALAGGFSMFLCLISNHIADICEYGSKAESKAETGGVQ
jgi:hypothetical protein